MRRRTALAFVLGAVLFVWHPLAAQAPATVALPSKLSDREFWTLVEQCSEPGGFFQSDNLVGNERLLQQVVPALHDRKRGGAYLGVAPDQNFTYIVALDPRIAFIVDIRRDNLLEHLMYKAIVELSPTRADFLSRLFSRKRPAGLTTDTSIRDLLEAYWSSEPDEALYSGNRQAIEEQLTRAHGFALSPEDVDRIAAIYQTFVRFGPSISYSSGGGSLSWRMPNYADMQLATDLDGREQGYLATEANYRVLKDFEERNLLVPVVGDFAGSRALRAVGAYVAAHGSVVTAFYVSNVEQYLFRNHVAPAFYENVRALPIDDASVFIRSASGRTVIDPIRTFLQAFDAGDLGDYGYVTGRGSVR